MKLVRVVLLAALFLSARTARADDDDDAEASRPPLPEPIFAETVTDIDGREPGEVEMEANASIFRARTGGAYALDSSIELEWLFLRRFGLRIEPTLSSDRVSSDGSDTEFGASGGVSAKLYQDFVHDFHVQAELSGRVPLHDSPIVQPGDPHEPAALDIRTAWRTGALTTRVSVGVGIGDVDAGEHVPLRGSVAFLAPFDPSCRFGFFGVELDADGGRHAPFVAAVDLVPDLTPTGLPFRLGVALPWSIAESSDRPSLGVFVRLFYESTREVEFGRKGR